MSRPVAVLVEHALAGDLALVRERRDVHALAAGAAAVGALGELVDHHALEDVLLVVPVVEDVLVEDVEDGRLDCGRAPRLLGRPPRFDVEKRGGGGRQLTHEPPDRHPQTISKGDEGQRDHEAREQRRHEDDEALGGDEVEEEPHDPDEEGLGCGLEVAEPVADDRVEDGDADCRVSEYGGEPREGVGEVSGRAYRDTAVR